MSLAAPARCFHHPDRPALAICVSCRRPLCQSCSTLWEGIHLCVSCLAERRRAATRSGAGFRTAAVGLAALGLLLAATWLRAWIAALVAELF